MVEVCGNPGRLQPSWQRNMFWFLHLNLLAPWFWVAVGDGGGGLGRGGEGEGKGMLEQRSLEEESGLEV